MPIIELSGHCRQAGFDGELLEPKNEEQQRTFVEARNAHAAWREDYHPSVYGKVASFVKWTGHNAHVLGWRYVTFKIIPDAAAIPNCRIKIWGYNNLIVVDGTSFSHEVLWPDHIQTYDHHSIICLLITAHRRIRHFSPRGHDHQHDVAVMDDAESECSILTYAVQKEQRRQKCEERNHKRKRT